MALLAKIATFTLNRDHEDTDADLSFEDLTRIFLLRPVPSGTSRLVISRWFIEKMRTLILQASLSTS